MDKNDIDNFQIKRSIINLYKSFLIILEDLQNDQHLSLERLKNIIPEQSDLIDQSNCFTKEKMQYIRKKILDNGNDCVRNLIGEK